MKKVRVTKLCSIPEQDTLFRMGLLNPDGEINETMLDAFVHIFAGQFVTDLYKFTRNVDEIAELVDALAPFAAEGKEDAIYLMISIQYDNMRKPLPSPIWSLFGCDDLIRPFCLGFYRQWAALTKELAREEAVQDGKAVDSRPG